MLFCNLSVILKLIQNKKVVFPSPRPKEGAANGIIFRGKGEVGLGQYNLRCLLHMRVYKFGVWEKKVDMTCGR